MRESTRDTVTGEPTLSALTNLEVADVLENERVVDVDGLADLVVHGVDVGLVDRHALPGQRRGVVDGDVVELRVVLPVLVFIYTNTVRGAK